MTHFIISESSIHYITGFMERYTDKYNEHKFKQAHKDIRDLSNRLLESLAIPFTITVARHNLRK